MHVLHSWNECPGCSYTIPLDGKRRVPKVRLRTNALVPNSDPPPRALGPSSGSSQCPSEFCIMGQRLGVSLCWVFSSWESYKSHKQLRHVPFYGNHTELRQTPILAPNAHIMGKSRAICILLWVLPSSCSARILSHYVCLQGSRQQHPCGLACAHE